MPISSQSGDPASCPSNNHEASWTKQHCGVANMNSTECYSQMCQSESSRTECPYAHNYRGCMEFFGFDPTFYGTWNRRRGGGMVSPGVGEETQFEEFDRMRYDMCIEKGSSDHVCKTMLPVYHR